MEGENTGPINIGNPGFFTILILVILMFSAHFFSSSVVLVWIDYSYYSFRRVYYDWTCWECEGGQLQTIL